MTDEVFEDLVNLYLDKEINPAQLNILKEELGRNPLRQKTFESYCRMHQATHFAVLSASPVIPRSTKNVPGSPIFQNSIWGFNRHVVAAAAIAALLTAFAAVYFNGPLGSARIIAKSEPNLEKIETFVEAESVRGAQPLEFFRAMKAENGAQNWSYVQELRHARHSTSPRDQNPPSMYTWADQSRAQNESLVIGEDFELEYSSYEFKR